MTRKRRIRNRAFALLLLLLLAPLLCACSADAPEEKAVYTGTLEEKIDAFYAEHESGAAGMQMAVLDRQGLVFKGYYGCADRERQLPFDETTVVDWGSSTKLLVWVSVMQLWEQGKLELEADVRDYLPEGFLSHLQGDKAVRMLDLMNHRAGFQEHYTDLFLQPGQELLSLEQALLQDPPPQIFAVDTVTAYSNWGVALAGYIVERVSGLSFCDYVHRNIFAPLGMENSALAPDLSDNPSVRERRESLVCYAGTKPLGSAFYEIQLYPAGSCVSTLDDYLAFAGSLIQDRCPLFASQDSFEAMMTASSCFGDTSVGRNAHGFWALPYGENTWGHGGNTAGCSSYLLFDPQRQLAAVVMCNQAGEEQFNGEMMELVFGESAWDYPAPERRPKGMLHPARTVLQGHFRIAGESFLSPGSMSELLWTYNEKDGIAKIEAPYSDYYFVSFPELLPSVLAVYGWAAAAAFSLAALLLTLLRGVLRRLRKKPKPARLPGARWSGAAVLLQLLIALAVLLVVAMVTSWRRAEEYLWLFPTAAALGALLAVLAVYGALWTRRNWKALSGGGRAYRITALLFAALTVYAMIYEQIW